MKITTSKKGFRVWIIVSLILVLLWAIVINGIYDNQANNKKAYLDNELIRLEGEVDSILLTYENFSDYIFDELDQDQDIKDIMQAANIASEIEKNVLRDKLYNKLLNRYLMMKKYEYRQFHFHLPNTESFLRIHAPDKYGDILYDFRDSVRLTNENLIKSVGFEEGKIFNGFRYVYPLLDNNNHLGSVELSISSKSLIKILSELYSREDFYFIIDKSTVDEKLFTEELDNYEVIEYLSGYYVDKEIKDATNLYNTVIPKNENIFFDNIEASSLDKINNKESFSFIHQFENIDYTVTFLAVDNFDNTPVAYMISIKESVGIEGFTKSITNQVMLVTLLVISIILFALLLAYYNLKLKIVSEIDFLTKTYKRNKFYELAKREEKLTKRYNYESSILFIDIDHFKKINDEYGHEIGDIVLKTLASEISKVIRDVDIFARWGGEEFVLLLPHTNKEGGLTTAEKIRKTIEKSKLEKLKDVTVSIGVATINLNDSDIDKAIKLADEAMYLAKENGRNQVCYK